jgi:hypothetical protein
MGFFEIGSPELFAWGLALNFNPPDLCLPQARIIGMSHLHLAGDIFFLNSELEQLFVIIEYN